MNQEFYSLYNQLMENKINTSQFLNELKLIGDYSDDLLEALQESLANERRTALSRLIWAIQWVPYKKFTPVLCELLDSHRYDGYMEAIADMLFDINDEKSIPSIIRALDYHVEGDGSYSFNIKLIDALKRINTQEAIDAIKLASRSSNEMIKEAAEEALEI